MFSHCYRKEVSSYVEKLARELDTHLTVILFGSFARDDAGPGSDVDLVVISDALPAHPLDRSKLLYDANLTGAPIEPKGYTKAEFLRLIDRRNPIALDSLTEGEALNDSGFWKKAKEHFELVRVEAELEKRGRFWISRKMLRENRRAG